MSNENEIIEYSTGDMVTIDELLKDDPKALEELKELRKWMDEHPEVFDFPEEKVTQGSRKIKQLLEDARRSVEFREGLNKITSNEPLYSPADLQDFYVMYRKYHAALTTFREQFLMKHESHGIKKQLCKEYGIPPYLFDLLYRDFQVDRLEGWDFSDESAGDVCILESQEDKVYPMDIHTFHVVEVDDIEREVYPINIKLHRFASKRDVLDFIEKRWEDIKPFLAEKRTKERKIERPVADFIWKHRGKKAKDIKLMLDKKFPKNGLMYFDITKVISEEKKRRGNKIIKKKNSVPR